MFLKMHWKNSTRLGFSWLTKSIPLSFIKEVSPDVISCVFIFLWYYHSGFAWKKHGDIIINTIILILSYCLVFNLVPSASFRYKRKAKKRLWNTSNTWLKFAQIEGIFFQNKLRNPWTTILKIGLLRLQVYKLSM